ncbi:MAG: DMT family transporter [Bdellovibrionales bacterium]|nr:DMT family transporter [Bdellovibrionales bacterium]
MKSKKERSPALGLFAGASTGVFWGVPFLVPQVLPGYSPFEIAFGRFFFFGLMGFFFAKGALSIVRSLSPVERFRVFLLSASGFWFYSSVLFWSIRQTDGILSSLVLGMLPVTIPLCTPGKKSGGVGFYSGLLLIAAGLVLLFAGGGGLDSPLQHTNRIAGVIGLFVCLGMWTWFSISNSAFLQDRKEISRRDFSSLMGLISFGCLLVVSVPTLLGASWGGRESALLYVCFSALLGVGSSWFANWLWNVASVHLPSEISGTLLVFETIFGVLYTLIFQARLPDFRELIAVVLCLVGVLLAIIAQIRAERAGKAAA